MRVQFICTAFRAYVQGQTVPKSHVTLSLKRRFISHLSKLCFPEKLSLFDWISGPAYGAERSERRESC